MRDECTEQTDANHIPFHISQNPAGLVNSRRLPSTAAMAATGSLTNRDTVRSGGFVRHFVIRLSKRNNEVLRNPSPDYKPTDIMNL